MTQRRMGQWCQAVLPPGFEQLNREAPSIQFFLEKNLPESVRQCVKLLTFNRDEVVIAASTPAVASYLRMHSREIEQQLREALGLQQRVRFCSMPLDLLEVKKSEDRRQPLMPCTDSVAAVRRNAKWIEDEQLREAMIALANSLESG